MTVAAAAHAVKSYGNRVGKGEANKCFLLSPKQKAGVKEMLANKIDGDIRLADLAGQSNMPGLQLMRSYQETTGKRIHDWSAALRVERAKDLLLRKENGLEEIARAAGYPGVDHFVTEFTRYVGIDPQRWRRQS